MPSSHAVNFPCRRNLPATKIMKACGLPRPLPLHQASRTVLVIQLGLPWWLKRRCPCPYSGSAELAPCIAWPRRIRRWPSSQQ